MDTGKVFCYLDDILISSSTWKEHCDLLQMTLTAVREANLKLSTRKCSFGCGDIAFLGYSLTKEDVTIA